MRESSTSTPASGILHSPWLPKRKKSLGLRRAGSAVEDARFNIKENGIRNCDFHQGRVEDLLKHGVTPKPDLIVLDPPRMGSKWIINQIARLKPKKIVYTSCEPTTFARDLRLFSEIGYSPPKAHTHRYVPSDLPYGGGQFAPERLRLSWAKGEKDSFSPP